MTILRRTTVRLTPADQAANRYPAFPFEAPKLSITISITLFTLNTSLFLSILEYISNNPII